MKLKAVVIAATILAAAAANAQNVPQNAPQVSLARQIADGQPWNMTMAEGRTGRLTLRSDGTGQMQAGPMNLSATWRETRDGLCLKPMMAGERCATLIRQGNTVIGANEGREQFRLSR